MTGRLLLEFPAYEWRLRGDIFMTDVSVLTRADADEWLYRARRAHATLGLCLEVRGGPDDVWVPFYGQALDGFAAVTV